jgi:predicted acylesterase/phospholipase RssA
VPISGRAYVDGGVHSLVNLELAAEFGADLAVCVAPMAYDLGAPPLRSASVVMRFWPSVSLRAERRAAGRAGTQVVVLAPGETEVRAHGWNLMRSEGLHEVALAAYDAAARAIAACRLGDLLSGGVVDLAARRPARRRQGRGRSAITALRECPPTGGTRAITR